MGGRGPPWGPTEADIFSATTPPPPPPPPRRVVSADRFPGADPSHTSRHGPRTERRRRRRQLWRILRAAHGCRRRRRSLRLCSLGVSHAALSSLCPPTPLRPASPLHRRDSRGAHLVILTPVAESSWGRSVASAATGLQLDVWAERTEPVISLSLSLSHPAPPPSFAKVLTHMRKGSLPHPKYLCVRVRACAHVWLGGMYLLTCLFPAFTPIFVSAPSAPRTAAHLLRFSLFRMFSHKFVN